MATKNQPELYVVDGSNIATEGRTAPSLEQLNEAVLAFLDAHPQATVTVVVDATFGHRIAKQEVKAFDEAVANNELVTPPAGAVGRGDAFVLAIAERAKAGILSNDSFQEFHGDYEWLFDDGRLIGGKPVPHVGWVFVKRTPVRGPRSRQAVREARDDGEATEAKERAKRRVRRKSESAAEPADAGSADEVSADDAIGTTVDAEPEVAAVDDAPTGEDRPSRRGRRGRKRSSASLAPDQQATIDAAKAASAPREHINDLVPFLEFVEHHPLGTSCTAVVESYSSHGAYARVDDVLVYIPLRLMDDPAPRSARSVLALGDAVTTVIVGYVPDRRSIDAALPHMAADLTAQDGSPVVADLPAAGETEQVDEAPAKRTAPKKTAAKKTAAKKTAAKKTAAKKTAAEKSAGAQTMTEAAPTADDEPADQVPAKKVAAKKAPAKKAVAKKTAADEAPAKKAAAKKTAADEAPAKKAAAKKTAAKKTVAEKAPAKKAAAKKTVARKTVAEKAPAKKAAAKKAPAKKAPAKKAPAKKAPAQPSGDA
jgi:hypothetical protein